jgi:putative sterol carrier protein
MPQDLIAEFFCGLAEQSKVPTFAGQSATLRFDIGDDDGNVERWHVAVDKGKATVSRQHKAADAVVRVNRREVEALVTGRMNAQAALLRGALECEGSLAALMMFQRCLPGPPGATGRVEPIDSATVMSWRRP